MSARTAAPLWLAGLLVVLAFAFQGTRGIWEPDEGRYTAAALNMLASGDYLLPTIDGEHLHLTKPPLTYWALAGSFAIFGHNEWAARLPASLAFVGTGLLVFGLGRRFSPSKPWLPALVYSLSLAPFLGSNVVSTDALLVFFETAAMYCFVRAWTGVGELDRGWLRAMWLAWGLAFTTKGPPGLLPLAAVAAMLALRDRVALRRLFDLPGLAAFVVMAFTWFAVLIAQDPARLGYFVGYEVYDRVFTATHNRNAEWYGAALVYGPAFLLGALPWWPVALAAAGGPRAAWSGLSVRIAARDRDWLLLLWWFALPLAVFCLAKSRLQLYVSPLFVPLALMMSRPLARWPRLGSWGFRMFVATTAAALVALKGIAGHVLVGPDARAMADKVRDVVAARGASEVAFVNMRPYYGLNLYLGVHVEVVDMLQRRMRSKYESEQDLCSELARREATIYAVKEARSEEFVDAVARCGGGPARPVGRFEVDRNRVALFMVESSRLD
jgi:4-amino-4-deoxy-L-arabinose transferase-like glycosyltransferase